MVLYIFPFSCCKTVEGFFITFAFCASYIRFALNPARLGAFLFGAAAGYLGTFLS
jgi:hypothetical protein